MESVSVFIGGDVVPMRLTIPLFKEKMIKNIFGELIPIMQSADIRVANLEAPIIVESPSPIEKSGPSLYAPKETIETLKEASFDVLTLANNHFRDQGDKGVATTIESIIANEMDFVGGGRNAEEARRILYKKTKGKTIAFINVCENEFSVASIKHGGANGLDLINLHNDIKDSKTKADYSIVIVHGGVEHYQHPTPRMKRLYRHLVDLGADAVINHHQHCVCGYEVYCGKPIFYGLGNFNFAPMYSSSTLSKWNYGYAVLLSLSNEVTYQLVPYVQNGFTPGLIKRNEEDFNAEIEKLNNVLIDDCLLEKKYKEYVASQSSEIQIGLLPTFLRNRVITGLIRRGFLGVMYKGKQIYQLKNRLSCESHLDVLLQYFKIRIEDDK